MQIQLGSGNCWLSELMVEGSESGNSHSVCKKLRKYLAIRKYLQAWCPPPLIPYNSIEHMDMVSHPKKKEKTTKERKKLVAAANDGRSSK